MSTSTSSHVHDPLPAAAAILPSASASQQHCCGEAQGSIDNVVAASDMEDGGMLDQHQEPSGVTCFLLDAPRSLQGSPAWGSSPSSPSPSVAETRRYGTPTEANASRASAPAAIDDAAVDLNGGSCNGVGCEEVPPHDDAASSTTTTLVRAASSSSSVNMQEVAAGVMSSCSNEPSSLMEEARVWTDLDKVEEMGEDLCLEGVKPSSEDSALRDSFHTSSSCRGQSSCSEDAFMSELDELLQCETTGFLNDSSLPCVDDFLPEFSATHEIELPAPPSDPACLGQWNMGSSQECDLTTAASSLPDFTHVAGSTDVEDGGEESVPQLFAQWLKSNAHCFSLNDLKKIKLKTSTIESATRRLGGGKKGLAQFLRFVLIWIQNCHLKQGGSAVSAPGSCSVTVPSNKDGELLNTLSPASSSATSKVGYTVRDGLVLGESAHSFRNGSTHSVWNGGIQSEAYAHANKRVHLSDQRESIWNSLAQPCSNQWRVNEYNGRSLPLHEEARFKTTTSTPATVEQTGWNRQQRGNSAVMCGGLPAVQGCIGVYNHVPQTIAPNSTSFSQSPAATTRAARKSRMERQRWSVRRHHHHAQRNKAWTTSTPPHTASTPCATASQAIVFPVNAASWSSQPSGSSHTLSSASFPRASARNFNTQLGVNPTSTADLRQQGRKAEKNLRLLFQKELKQSDVGSLGRIVLPKAAETSLPPLELRDGVSLVVEDLNSSKVWNMRYRFWPNNKSRMYLLENTGDFVKSYDLKEGDYMMLYYSSSMNKYMIKGAKGVQLNNFAAVSGPRKVISTAGAPSNTQFGKLDSVRPVSTDIFASDDSCGDDILFAELIEQSLEDVDDLPEVLDLTS